MVELTGLEKWLTSPQGQAKLLGKYSLLGISTELDTINIVKR